MTAAPLPRSISAPRAFQFRLGTLLIATTWIALFAAALRSPTTFLSGLIAILTYLILMVAVLVVVYRTGRTRASAVGFVVFCFGYLLHSGYSPWLGGYGLSLPFGALFDTFGRSLHGDTNLVDQPWAGLLSSLAVGPPYQRSDFVSTCNHALATLLGIAGAITAQFLYATQPPDSANQKHF